MTIEHIFKTYWRPALGWTCVISLFAYYVPYCVVSLVVWARLCVQTHSLLVRPDLNIADLIGLISSLLGIAGMRTAEKFKGVA